MIHALSLRFVFPITKNNYERISYLYLNYLFASKFHYLHIYRNCSSFYNSSKKYALRFFAHMNEKKIRKAIISSKNVILREKSEIYTNPRSE